MWKHLSVSALVFCLVFSAWASDRDDDVQRLQKATQVFQEIMNTPDKGIPQELLESAKCIAIIPGEKKAAFVVGGNYGKGLATCRTTQGWSAPLFVTIAGGNVGLQIGGSSTDIVMLFMNDRALQSLLSDKFKVGADVTAAAGPVGRHAAADTDIRLNAEILTYSRSKGAFAGVSLDGAVVQPDSSGNHAMYGADVSRREILSGSVPAPAAAQPLLAEISAQTLAPTSSSANLPTAPRIRRTVFARNVNAVDYHSGKSTRVGFRGTDLMPSASGEAKVQSKDGRTKIEAKFDNLVQPNVLGLAYLTYVLWAISPEGRSTNVGEILVHEGRGEVRATTGLQAFGMIVTAEPDFAVTEPSDRVVLENVVLPKTQGMAEPILARYEVLPRSVYLATNQPLDERVYGLDSKAPLDLLEARNALRIARDAGAPQYASASFDKAQHLLNQAEDYYARGESKDLISTVARQAVQTAEEARVMAIKRSHDEQQAAQRHASEQQAVQAQQQAATAQQSAASAQAQAEREAQRHRRTQAKLQAEQEARRQAEQQAQNAQAAAQRAEQDRQLAQQQLQQAELDRQQAEAGRQAALQQQQAAQAEAQRAQLTAQQAERDKEQTRAQLQQQLNRVLQTKDTASGLIINMPDVLFDAGKATLKASARERLAKVAGIILAYPDLHLKVEGFTDSVGSDEYNLKLSEMRAAAVRDYLIGQGVPVNNVVAQGFGKANPIASNATPRGRQQNRRVDLVVTGAAIGMQLAPQR